MNIDFSAEHRFWLYVPAVFPFARFTDVEAWAQASAERYSEAKPEATPEELHVVTRLMAEAQTRLAEAGAEFGLQFWPTTEPLTLLFLVAAIDAQAGADPYATLFDGILLSRPPEVEELEVAGANRAVMLSFLASATPDTEIANLAGLAGVVECDAGTILVRSEPTLSTMVGLAAPQLREVLETFTLTAR